MGHPAMTTDYEPVLETALDGTVTDMLIEDLLGCIYAELYDAEQFDKVYTGVVRTHINPDCPDLMAGHAGRDRINTGAVHYICMLQLSFTVLTCKDPTWPGFSDMPDAKVAVSIHYPDTDECSDYAPGTSINQASLAAIIQLARERSIAQHNHSELPLRGRPYDA